MQKSKLQCKIRNYFIGVLAALLLMVSAIPVFAAELFFEAKSQEFRQGEEFLASIFLNSLEESINAVEGRVFFPENLLEVKEIRDGNSIINFWIERPRIEQAGAIGFSGIIPGGYQETKGFVFSVVFQAKASGNGAIEIRDAKVLLNDGEGTLVKTTISNFQFSISKEAPGFEFQVLSFKDTDPPEEFKPEIASDFNIFDGKWFLVFATQDKGSGIAGYAVHESRRMKTRIATNQWKEAESPYVLEDQELRSYIDVKAFDKAGNERIVSLPPRYPLAWYENYFIWIMIISGALLAIMIGYLIRKFLWKKFIKSR